MMASRVLSRVLPTAEGDTPFFHASRHEAHRNADIESQRPSSASTREAFHDDDDETDPNQLLFEGTHDGGNEQASEPSTQYSPPVNRTRPKWFNESRRKKVDDDDDVPESFLLETNPQPLPTAPREQHQRPQSSRQARTAAQWRATQEQHGLYPPQNAHSRRRSAASARQTVTGPAAAVQPNPQADAMWMYTNAPNLDRFLLEVYQYYIQHGVWSILLARVLELLTELFVFSFFTFLTTCIDYSLVSSSHSTAEVMIPKCMSNASWIKNAALYIFVIYWLYQCSRYASDVRRLFQMRNFYEHVLGISDANMQTVEWKQVVEGLVKVQNANIATAANPSAKARAWTGYGKPQQRVNAETVANRLMRKDNYYVAMYNKEILDFSLPLPFAGTKSFYSKSLEYCIDFCLTNFIFDEQGSIRPFCLEVRNREALVKAVRTRLQFAALISIPLAPFNIVRFCIMFFFRYYTEFTRNPSKVSARSFTPFAEWKIRQFNELEHLFQRRLRKAHPYADEYLKQFPKDKTDQFFRFVAFVSGAVAAVLTVATLLDHELFLGFEVMLGRTAVFWLTVTVGVFGFAHGMLPDEHEVLQPVLHLEAVLMYTRYEPSHWKNRLHTEEVRAEFSALYQMKIVVFIEEVLSLIVTPWILYRNAVDRSDRIIDFFRDQTVHVDGIGYQCNFAVFGFKKDPNAEDPTTLGEADGLRDEYFGDRNDKMTSSMHGFMQYYDHVNRGRKPRLPKGWQPPPAWPGMGSPPTIKEEPTPSASTAQIAARGTAQEARQPLGSRPAHQASIYQPRAGPPASKATQSQGMSESRIMAQDSDLQDYVDAPSRDGLMESDTDGEDGKGPGDGAGVLGMLVQFSKAKADRGTGVNL